MNRRVFNLVFALLVIIVAMIAPSAPLSAQGPALVKGPYLQAVTQTSITVMWQTDAPAPSALEYGDPAITLTDDTAVMIHAITISDLAPGTEYVYRIDADGSGARWSDWYSFVTAPEFDAPFRLVVYGDTRTFPEDHAAVANAILASHPALVLHTGDLVENGVLDSRWTSEFFTPAADLLARVPLYPVLGNHEKNGRPYFDLFDLPSEHEQWYAFTYGSVRFIALNTSAAFGVETSQYAWLVEELQSEEFAAAAWQIVYFHHPVFSSGVEYFAAGDMADLFPPLFEQYGVDIVFSGHEHNYERSEKDGVIYVVTGGGGAPLYGHSEDPLAVNPYSLVRFVDYHHCVLDITPEQIVYTVLDNSGTVMDEFTLVAD